MIVVWSCKPKSCQEQGLHDTTYFENKSERLIEFILLGNYPDTIYPEGSNPTTDYLPLAKPHSTVDMKKPCVHQGKDCCIEESFENDEKYWLYIFDRDSINLLSWNTVRTSSRGLLERRKVDLNYLIQQNFTLVYEE